MIKKLLCIAPLALLCGCAIYQPKPINRQAISGRLAAPDIQSLRIKARQIKHPVLKPRNIDFAKGISAQDAAIIAVIANPQLRAERDRLGIANAQLLQAGILPNPAFSYSLDVPSGGSDQGTVNAYGLGLDWSIIKSLLTRGPKIDAARANKESVSLGIAWQEWQVAQSARLEVYRVMMLEQQLKIAKNEENALLQNLQAIKKAVDEGNMTIVDLDAVESTLRSAHSTALSTSQKLEQERLRLNLVLGFPPKSNVPLKKNMAFPALKTLPALDGIMKGIENRRLDLLALKQGYQSQEATLREAVRAQFPSIGIGFSHARDTTNVITTGFSLSIKLPFFNRNQGHIAIEKTTRQMLYDEYMNRIFQARADAAAILANIKAVQAQISAADQSVAALERLVSVSYNGFLEGNIDALSYYNAVNRLATRRLDALKLRQTLAELHVALEISAGEYLQ
ncbi:MAG: TolC family protein [Nitrospiraceae bacterium]|nr:TolC family protein [Nitrospiraceae bacterium]